MALSHWLELEPRAGLVYWASKTSLFMTQVNYCTKDHFNGWENICSTQLHVLFSVSVCRQGEKYRFYMTHNEVKAFFMSSKFGQIKSNGCGRPTDFFLFFFAICVTHHHNHTCTNCIGLINLFLDLGNKNIIFPIH